MPPKKSKSTTEYVYEVPVTCRRDTENACAERKILRSRFAALLFECDDFWSGKREKHSHVHPIFKEYWRLVQIAHDLYQENMIFEELDISQETQPNADDIQAIEMDVRKMLAVFEVEDSTE
ncbi:MAG: hypothetical protein Q7J68_03160 [Thermoplasmata archaeon]|nr:hypothetical protein [Thermoplasmata archaeon]